MDAEEELFYSSMLIEFRTYRMGITNVIPRDNAIDNLLNLRKRIKSVAKKEQIIQRIQELRKLY